MNTSHTGDETRTVRVGENGLEGQLTFPTHAAGLVIFAHGSGSGRLSPRNTHVAAALNRRSLATLLFDLLTEHEARDRANVFDIPLLGGRVVQAVDWARARGPTGALAIGLFGASTGAAAALVAAARRPQQISAVVSRGGRPDLAGAALARVRAPTLLIVGGADEVVLELNRRALASLECERRLEIVPGATHLFEEAGALDRVIVGAGDWFETHLAKGAA